MIFTFEDSKKMYQSDIFKLMKNNSLKKKLSKASEILKYLDNTSIHFNIKKHLLEQYINKLNYIESSFRKSYSGKVLPEELFLVQKNYLDCFAKQLKQDENGDVTESIINKVFDLSEDIHFKLETNNIDLINSLRYIITLEYGMLFVWLDYYEYKFSNDGTLIFNIIDNKLQNLKRNFIAFTWEKMSVMSDEFVVFNNIDNTITPPLIKFITSKLFGFSIDTNCIKDIYEQKPFCTINFDDVKKLLNYYTELVSLIVNLKIHQTIILDKLFSLTTQPIKEYILHLQSNPHKINDLPIFFNGDLLISDFSISNVKHITRTIVNDFFRYKDGQIDGKYGQCIGMLFEKLATCWLNNNKELNKYGYQLLNADDLFRSVDSETYKTTKCDSDIILVNKNGNVYFLQFKYRVQKSTPIYLEEEIEFSQNNDLLTNGILQLNNLKKEINSNRNFKEKIESYILKHSGLTEIKFYNYTVIHNLHNFDFLEKDGVSVYDWNTFKNLLTTFFYQTNTRTNNITYNNHLSSIENIPISNVKKMQEHVFNYDLQIKENTYTNLKISWEHYLEHSYVYCGEKVKFQF
ncbi:MAG: hypothetical protein AB7D38_04485 [Sulfurimonas sp.]|uniref:hypothetical protein n=1 Tax=Sulfurimonas sp. TaxID=2022749 RepID=UPI003D13292E